MSLAMHSAKGKLTLEAAAPSSTHSTMVGGSYDGKIAGLYDLEETLGSGHFAVVKLARHVFTGAKVAVKVVDKTKLDEVSKAHLFQEVRCMKLVQHPNVVRLYEVIDTQTKLYLVLELGDGGDLYDYIMKHEGGLSEDLARKYFRQILRAITYCHELHVVHRDLKPENVVFFEKLGVVKLTDFGFSNKFLPGQKLQTSCGSLAYSAPEILLGDSYDAPAVDIWSLGVILYMLVCGVPPFEKANDSETLTMIMDCKYTVPAHISASCRKLIASMLVRDPKQRASLEQIAADPWLKENVEYDNNDFLPLVSREEISEEDHAFIIQKMVNGKVTTKEEILQSLDKNMYNHITATYYLLAEMLLRKRQEEQTTSTTTTNARNDTADMMLSENATTTTKTKGGENAYNARPMPDNKTQANPNDDGQKVVIPISINVCAPTPNLHETKPEKRSRKCSIVREEDEEESSCEQSAHHGNELKVGFGRRESISDGRLNRSVQERAKSPVAAPVVVSMHARNKMLVPVDAALAQKLNQIEKHSDPALATAKSKLEEEEALQDLKELDIGKLNPLSSSSKNPVLTHRRSKLNKIRTPSCSSSEASDDDTKARNKKKMNKYVGDTPSRFRMHRRDSHDDSSDSQDPTFPSAGSHANTNILGSNNSNVGNGKKESQTQSKDQNKSDDKDKDTRKSSHSHSHKNKKHHKHEQNPDKHSQQSDCRKSLSSTHNNNNNNNNNHHHINSNNNNHNHNNNTTTSRRRIRESQSLDRITEAQEYELRHRCLGADSHIEQRNSLFNLNSYSLIETKEEYDEESQMAQHQQQQQGQETITDLTQQKKEHHQHQHHHHDNPNSLNGSGHALLHLKKRNKPNMYKLNSIEEIDLILEERSLAKAIQVTSSKCFVTMKKIRRLGKYFPVVNFS